MLGHLLNLFPHLQNGAYKDIVGIKQINKYSALIAVQATSMYQMAILCQALRI